MDSAAQVVFECIKFDWQLFDQQVDEDSQSRQKISEFREKIVDKALNIFYHKSMDQVGLRINRPFNLVVRWIEPGGPKSGSAQGLGDLSNAVKTVKMFQRQFPSANIFMTNKFYEEEETLTAKANRKHIIELDVSDKNNELLLGIYSPKALRKYLRTNYSTIPTIMFDVATPDKTLWPFKIKDIKSSKLNLMGCYHIDEYNGKRTKDIGFDGDLRHNWFSEGIGLDKRKNPAIGVHLDPTLADKSLSLSEILPLLENEELRNHLNRPEKREFYFGYSSEDDEAQYFRFINTVLEYEAEETRKNDVEFFLLTQDRYFVKKWFKNIFEEEWQNSAYRSIIVYDQKKEDLRFEVLLNPNAKRTIRFSQWHTHLPHHDMRLLMQATGKVILVTGDQSWSEAVSLKNRVILYEVREWKFSLVQQMFNLSILKYGEESKISNYFLKMANIGAADRGRTWISRNFAQLLRDEEFLCQHRGIMELVHERYNAETWLFGMIERQISRHDFPSLENAGKPFRKNLRGQLYTVDVAEVFSGKIQNAFNQLKVVKRERPNELLPMQVVATPFRRELVGKVSKLFGAQIPVVSSDNIKKKQKLSDD